MHRRVPGKIAALAVFTLAFFSVMCQELPTEPEPIDLTNEQPQLGRDTLLVAEDDSIRANVLQNDSSPVGQSLTLAEISRPPTHGMARILDDEEQIQYVPEPNFHGTDSLEYRAAGEVLASNTWVIIFVTSVNDPPVAGNDRFTIDEERALSKLQAALDVLANDTDIDGDVLKVLSINSPSTGNAELNAGSDGILYTPPPDFFGTVPFTYVVTDGRGGLDTANVVVEVASVNDVPIAVDDSYQLNEDTDLTIQAPGVLANDTDVEGDALQAVLETPVQQGDLTLNLNGSFTYSPNDDFSGTDSFTYRAQDGTSASEPARVMLRVTSLNDPPLAVDDAYTMDQGQTLTVDPPGVLGNDNDPDGDPLIARLVMQAGQGTVTLLPNGSFTYAPNPAFSGVDTFTYRANDGSDSNIATVTITVNSVNTAPTARPDAFVVNRNQTLNVAAPGVLQNDTDAEGDVLTAVLQTQVTNGDLSALNPNGSFTYTPNPGFVGTDTFTYRAFDGLLSSVVTTVVISVENRPPVAIDDGYTLARNETDSLFVPAPGVLENDVDADGDSLMVVLDTEPTQGTLSLNPDGSFLYVIEGEFLGTDQFTYHVTDGLNDSQPATVLIEVQP